MQYVKTTVLYTAQNVVLRFSQEPEAKKIGIKKLITRINDLLLLYKYLKVSDTYDLSVERRSFPIRRF